MAYSPRLWLMAIGWRNKINQCRKLKLNLKEEKKERIGKKDSAGSDDTASMIKGGGYLGARTRQPPTAQTIKKKLMWVREVVCC